MVVFLNGFVAFDGFVDDRLQNLHCDLNVEAVLCGQFLDALGLTAFARRIGGGKVMLVLVQANLIRDFETLRQKQNQTSVKLVQMLPQNIKLWITHRPVFYTADTPAASAA